jgi:hypothetical protein
MALDSLVLGGTSISDEVNYVLETLDLTPPKRKAEWAQAADADGADLIRTPLYENRTITATIRVAPQASKDAALAKVGTLVDLLQEAEKNPAGLALEYTPASATKKITFYVLTAEVTSVPMVNEGSGVGWYANAPQLVVAFTCRPFGYGVEVEAAAAKSIETGLSIVTITLPTVEGDVPAEGRLVIKDTAAVGRRFVEWGLQNRYYDAATALIRDSEDLTPVGGVQSTELNAAGAYKRAGATNGTIATMLLPEPTICCNTGVLKHIGTFRVKARVATQGEQIFTRLSYQDGEGPLRANAWTSPPTGTFCEVDLGTITLTPAILGTQKWLGQVEAYSLAEPASTKLHVDYLTFIPVAEGYGKARGSQSSQPGTIIALDNFTTGTLSGSLNARTPALGTAWATSGAATDWVVESAAVKRTTTGDAEPRIALFGSAQGNSKANLVCSHSKWAGASSAILLRATSTTNYAFCSALITATATTVSLGVVVAGVTTTIKTRVLPSPLGGGATSWAVELIATLDAGLYAAGFFVGAHGERINFFSLAGTNAAIAVGGALASGKGGFYDRNNTGVADTRLYQMSSVQSLTAIPYCVQPSRTMEVHSDSAIAQDSTGTYYGPVPQYRGSRFYVPQDGSANRTSRILVKADRNDLQESDQQTIADAFTAACFCTPRFLAIPR